MSRPPVLLVHGAWSGSWVWDGWVASLEEKGIEVHTVDLRGHGANREPGDEGLNRHRLRGYVDDVAAAVLAIDRPPVVIGHSMGGGVVQHLLARADRPRLAGAVLLASMAPFGVARVTAALARRSPGLFARANARLDLGLLVEDRDTARWLLFSPQTPRSLSDPIIDRLQGESYLAFLDMLGTDLPSTPEVPEPVLVVGGEEDTIFRPWEVRRTAQAWETVARIYPGMGHQLQHEPGTEQVLADIVDWLPAA